MDRKRVIVIQSHEEGLLLLVWISARYTYHTLEKWEKYINDERVTLNNRKIEPEAVLHCGDIITYYPEPVIEPHINSVYNVVFEDDDLLVIDKPPDLPCHPGGIYYENTLWYILKQKYEYLSLVNRLDRETSGIMLIAKNKASASFYFNKMRERNIDKEYLVLVHGYIANDIDAGGWLEKDSNSIIRRKRKFTLDVNARLGDGLGDADREFAHSYFTPIKSDDKYTLLNCKLFTGRTHQIRATICSLGFPVVGDKIYGLDDSFFFKFINDTLTEEEKDNLVISNQALHSCKTSAPMLNGERKTFTSSPPDYWPIKS